MHPIMNRIIAGEDICPSEINMFNANRLMDWVRDTDSHHTKEECRLGKNCPHAPGEMTIDWAATLVNEAAHICTCGEHGAHNPDEAARIIAEFRVRWSQDTKREPKVKR